MREQAAEIPFFRSLLNLKTCARAKMLGERTPAAGFRLKSEFHWFGVILVIFDPSIPIPPIRPF